MKKKLLAVLLVVALIMSIAPTAFAADDHTCEGGAWTPNGDLTHSSFCPICGEVDKTEPCTPGFRDPSLCQWCKGSMTPEPKCDHEGGAWISNGDGTHTSSCDCGANKTTGECQDLGKGVCYMCGYEFHKCDYTEAVSDGDRHHFLTCECGKKLDVALNCADSDGDRFCDSCGYEMYREVVECKHVWKGVANNDEATHKIVCRDCLEVLGTESHKFVNGVCACGAIYVEPECEHEWKGVTYVDEATHKVVCRDCLEVLDVESHKFVDGANCACGAIYAETECEHEWKGVIYIDEATHGVVCRDCLAQLTVESHKYVDNRPCACGAIYSEDHECDFEAGITSNEDGTHNINCSCGEFVTVKCLDNDGDGKCDSCGYQKYVAPEDPTEPEEPTEEPTEEPADPELDDVPKTGDNSFVILAVMTGIAFVSAMAFVFIKKRSVC